jgi:hypothetical protein
VVGSLRTVMTSFDDCCTVQIAVQFNSYGRIVHSPQSLIATAPQQFHRYVIFSVFWARDRLLAGRRYPVREIG